MTDTISSFRTVATDFYKFEQVYLPHSFLLCSPSCRHKSPWCKSHAPRTVGQCTVWSAHRTPCPSSHWNIGSGPWSTVHSHCTTPDTLLWNKTRQKSYQPHLRSRSWKTSKSLGQGVGRSSPHPFLSCPGRFLTYACFYSFFLLA